MRCSYLYQLRIIKNNTEQSNLWNKLIINDETKWQKTLLYVFLGQVRVAIKNSRHEVYSTVLDGLGFCRTTCCMLGANKFPGGEPPSGVTYVSSRFGLCSAAPRRTSSNDI